MQALLACRSQALEGESRGCPRWEGNKVCAHGTYMAAQPPWGHCLTNGFCPQGALFEQCACFSFLGLLEQITTNLVA